MQTTSSDSLSSSGGSRVADPVLLSFLQASSEAESQRRLQDILDRQARPLIDRILRRKMSANGTASGSLFRDDQEWDDLAGDVVLQIVEQLQTTRAEMRSPEAPSTTPIGDFGAYVAVAAYNSVNRHLRRRYPNRYSLLNKLRYLCDHREGLAVWQDARTGWTAGFSLWRSRERAAAGGSSPACTRLTRLRDNPQATFHSFAPAENPTYIDPAKLLALIFEWVGAPVDLDDLVAAVGGLWGVKDERAEPPPSDESIASSGKGSNVSGEVLGRFDLHRYWAEMRLLPEKQCAALLLQARDPNGNSLIELLETEGIVSLRDMAQAMGFSVERFAEICDDLPMDDADVAALIGVTAQHVARMRMNARRRIAERFMETAL